MQPDKEKQKSEAAPLLQNKSPKAASVFSPDALLREARRQKGLALVDVPAICILDPDGDILRRLRQSGRASMLGLAITPSSIRSVLARKRSASSAALSAHLLPY